MKHKNFEEFKAVMIILMHFDDNVSTSEINEYLQEWYVMYKEATYHDPKEWAEFWFSSVNRDEHDFWIDPGGR